MGAGPYSGMRWSDKADSWPGTQLGTCWGKSGLGRLLTAVELGVPQLGSQQGGESRSLDVDTCNWVCRIAWQPRLSKQMGSN